MPSPKKQDGSSIQPSSRPNNPTPTYRIVGNYVLYAMSGNVDSQRKLRALPKSGTARPGAGAPKTGVGAPKPGVGAPKPGVGAPKPGVGAPKPGA